MHNGAGLHGLLRNWSLGGRDLAEPIFDNSTSAEHRRTEFTSFAGGGLGPIMSGPVPLLMPEFELTACGIKWLDYDQGWSCISPFPARSYGYS